MGGCEQSCGSRELNPDPLLKQPVFFVTEPSLHPLHHIFGTYQLYSAMDFIAFIHRDSSLIIFISTIAFSYHPFQLKKVQLLFFHFYFVCMGVLPAYIFMSHMCVVPVEARRGHPPHCYFKK